ncbi:hypothetical protein N8Z85_02300 [Porticoccus sp.]|nr:hypothetical protein [Porticoccus sp.]
MNTFYNKSVNTYIKRYDIIYKNFFSFFEENQVVMPQITIKEEAMAARIIPVIIMIRAKVSVRVPSKGESG